MFKIIPYSISIDNDELSITRLDTLKKLNAAYKRGVPIFEDWETAKKVVFVWQERFLAGQNEKSDLSIKSLSDISNDLPAWATLISIEQAKINAGICTVSH